MNEIRFSYQGIEYELRDTKSVTILNSLIDYCKHRNSLELPDQVNNWDSSYKVKSIRSGAFTNISIENLTIDCSHFKSLPNRVFSFSSIKTLKLINTRSTFSMSGETFAFADDLENIIFDENEKNFLFQNGVLYDLKNFKVLFVTKNVQKIDVISSMVEISDFACQNCTQLTKVIFSNNSSLKRIGQYAFKNCTNLKIIELPNNISTIDKYAFENCFNLLNIKLSEQLAIIDKKAFYLCSSLEIIVIPSCIKLVGKKAFSRCSSLNNVYFCCSKKDVNIFKNSFDNDIHNENFNSKLSVIFDHVQTLDHDDVFFGEMQWEEYRQIEKLLIKAQAFQSKVQEEINQIAETKFVMKEEGSESNRNELFYQFLSDKQKLFDSMCNYIYGDEKTPGDAKLLELTLDHKNKEIKEIRKKIDQLKNQHLISKMNLDDMAREKESLFDDNRKIYSLKSELLEKENIRILLNEECEKLQSKVFDLEQIVKKLVPLEEILNSKEARRDNLYDHEIKTLKNNNYVLRNEVKKLLAIIKNKDPAEYQKLNDYYNDSELDLNKMDTFSDIFVPEIDEYNNSDQHENELKIQDDDEKIYKSNLRKDNLYSTFKFYDDSISCDVVQKVLNKSNKDILNNSDAIKSSFSQRNINYQHPYLATIIAMGPTSSVDVYYTKYYPRTLKDALRLNLFDHTRLSAIIGQIISGLTFLESKGIYHQSIKASNILLTDQHNVKIADYYTRITDFDLFTLGKKRLKHYPIEFVVKHDFGKRFDIYMFGLLLFKIVSGNTKIDYSASDILFGTKLQLPNTYSLNVKSWVIQLIKSCIGDPMRRPTFLDIHHLAIKENFCFFDNTDEYIMKAIIPIM